MTKIPSPGQTRELHSRLVRCAPDLDADIVQALNDAPLETISEFLAGLAKLEVLLPFPKKGVEFELTLNGDATDPLQMVRNDGYTGDWRFHGPKVVGVLTRKFKLVRAGYQPSLDAVKSKLGPLAEGEWREAFRRKFRPAPGAAVGFGGSLWTNSHVGRPFPYLFEDGGAWDSRFYWAGHDLSGSWLWLVPSK